MMDLYTPHAHNEFRHADMTTPKTVEGWKREARAHVASVASPEFTPADDYAIFHGLSQGRTLAEVAALRVMDPASVRRRFQTLRNGLLDRNGIFPLDAQAALIAVLREAVQ
jgi:hypothetical protein